MIEDNVDAFTTYQPNYTSTARKIKVIPYSEKPKVFIKYARIHRKSNFLGSPYFQFFWLGVEKEPSRRT